MDKDQITKVLEANPDVSLEDAKKQALEAGATDKDFYEAWNLTHRGYFDQRILTLMNEISTSETADKTSQKKWFKEKGYLDDEFDLAYCLKGARINTGPFTVRVSIILLIILGIGISFWLSHIGASNIALIFGFPPLLLYIIWIAAQKEKYLYKILSLDFDAKVIEEPELNALHKKLRDEMGSIYLKTTHGSFMKGLRLLYDKRPTYFLDHSYSIGSGKHKTTIVHTLIIQEYEHNFPNAFCYDVYTRMPSISLKNEVQLEGVDFNKAYKVYVPDDKKKVDAFYVLNPRVMSGMLEPKVRNSLKIFETTGNTLIVGTHACVMAMTLNTKPPIISYAQYKNIKAGITARLDLATDIADVLTREIVDKGDQRSIAKEM